MNVRLFYYIENYFKVYFDSVLSIKMQKLRFDYRIIMRIYSWQSKVQVVR